MVQHQMIPIDLLSNARDFHQNNLEAIESIDISKDVNAALQILAREIRKILALIDKKIAMETLIDEIKSEIEDTPEIKPRLIPIIDTLSGLIMVESPLIETGRSHE